MPIRKVQEVPVERELQRIAQNEIQRLQARQETPKIYIAILFIFVLFVGNVMYETNDNMNKEFTITDSQSRTCLVDFQAKKCNPLELKGECELIYECVKKEDDSTTSEKTVSLVNNLFSEIQENMVAPAVFTIILLIYQMTNIFRRNLRENID